MEDNTVFVTADEINAAYTILAQARMRYSTTALTVTDFKTALDATKGKYILEGLIQGKNEGEREAKARELLENDYTQLERAQNDEKIYRAELDCANYEVERIGMLMRLMEVVNAKPA